MSRTLEVWASSYHVMLQQDPSTIHCAGVSAMSHLVTASTTHLMSQSHESGRGAPVCCACAVLQQTFTLH